MTKSWSWEDCGEPNKPREDETIHVPKTEPSTRSDWPHSRISDLLFAWFATISWKPFSLILKDLKVFPCLSMSFLEQFLAESNMSNALRWKHDRRVVRGGHSGFRLPMTVTASPNFPFSPATSPHTLLLLVICYGVLLCFAGRNTSPHLESWEVWI